MSDENKGGPGSRFEQARARRIAKMNKPFLPQIAKLLFLAEVLLTVGFGILELMRIGNPGYALTPSVVLGSLLVGGLVPGLPLVAVCAVGLARLKKAAEQAAPAPQGEKPGEEKEPENPLVYKVCGGVTVGILGLLLLGWLVTLLLGL